MSGSLFSTIEVYADTRSGGRCRYCDARITWFEVVASGKRMPFNENPVALRTRHDASHRPGRRARRCRTQPLESVSEVMRRFQARRGNGRFARNTFENTLGLHTTVHERKVDGSWCGALNPSKVGEPLPTVCSHCGEVLAHRDGAHDTRTPEVRA